MIENNARRLKATRVLPFQPLPLDFAKLVAERRADRVGAHVRREATNRHADDIQQRVNAENQRNEQERIGKLLQVGAVPAHVLAPVIRQVIEAADDGGDLRTRTTIIPRTHTSTEYQTSTRARDRDFRQMPGLEDFDDRDRSLLQRGKEGLAITDSEGLFAFNTKMRARNAGYARAQLKTQADAATAKAKAKAALPEAATAKVPAKAKALPGTATAKVPPKAKAALPEAAAKVPPQAKTVVPKWPPRSNRPVKSDA